MVSVSLNLTYFHHDRFDRTETKKKFGKIIKKPQNGRKTNI